MEYAWNNPVNYTDPSGHWPQFLDDAVDSAVNFGRKVVNTVVGFGRNVVNSVTSFFTGSSSQTDARRTRTSSTSSAGNGKGVPTANSTVKRTRPAAGYQSTMKCNATLAVRAVGDIVKDIWDFIGPDETDMIMFQTGLITGAAVATIASPLVAAAVAIVISKGDDISKLLVKAIGNGADKAGSKIFWGSWSDYKKVTVNGQQYAKVGNRLYSKHAVDRMQPSGNRFGSRVTQAGGDYGRSVSPEYVESVIRSGKRVLQENGNYSYTSGSLQVITDKKGAVVTIITK